MIGNLSLELILRDKEGSSFCDYFCLRKECFYALFLRMELIARSRSFFSSSLKDFGFSASGGTSPSEQELVKPLWNLLGHHLVQPENLHQKSRTSRCRFSSLTFSWTIFSSTVSSSVASLIYK